MLFVRLFDLHLFDFVCFLFLPLGVWEGLRLVTVALSGVWEGLRLVTVALSGVWEGLPLLTVAVSGYSRTFFVNQKQLKSFR